MSLLLQKVEKDFKRRIQNRDINDSIKVSYKTLNDPQKFMKYCQKVAKFLSDYHSTANASGGSPALAGGGAPALAGSSPALAGGSDPANQMLAIWAKSIKNIGSIAKGTPHVAFNWIDQTLKAHDFSICYKACQIYIDWYFYFFNNHNDQMHMKLIQTLEKHLSAIHITNLLSMLENDHKNTLLHSWQNLPITIENPRDYIVVELFESPFGVKYLLKSNNIEIGHGYSTDIDSAKYDSEYNLRHDRVDISLDVLIEFVEISK